MCIVSVIHIFVYSYQRKFSILKLFICLSLQLPCLAINLRGSTRKSLNITESGLYTQKITEVMEYLLILQMSVRHSMPFLIFCEEKFNMKKRYNLKY